MDAVHTMGLRDYDLQYIQSKHGLYYRVKKLLVSQEWSDCTFSILGKHFKAHKLILTISSPVFEAMFYGPLSTGENIEITDIQPDIFQLMLNYVYTDNVEIDTIDQAFELLYASRKYMLELLSELCIAYIQHNVDLDNVFDVLSYPEYMQDKQIVESACKLICEHTYHLLQEKSIITCSCLKTVLESDYMNIGEKDLIKHVFEWSSHYCNQNNIPSTFENRRDVLHKNGIFQLLRFLSLSVNGLEEIVNDSSNLLLPSEIENIMKYIQSKNETNLKQIILCELPVASNTSPRKSLKLNWQYCHRSPIRYVAPAVIGGNNNMIESRIKVNKSVFIHSITIPTRIGPSLYPRFIDSPLYLEQISIVVQCERNKILNRTEFSQSINYNTRIEIILKEPCFLKNNEWYRISFIWPNNGLICSYPVEQRQWYYTSQKVLFNFEDMPLITSSRCKEDGSFLEGLKFTL